MDFKLDLGDKISDENCTVYSRSNKVHSQTDFVEISASIHALMTE